jgi:hypothetical protein
VARSTGTINRHDQPARSTGTISTQAFISAAVVLRRLFDWDWQPAQDCKHGEHHDPARKGNRPFTNQCAKRHI